MHPKLHVQQAIETHGMPAQHQPRHDVFRLNKLSSSVSCDRVAWASPQVRTMHAAIEPCGTSCVVAARQLSGRYSSAVGKL